MAGDPLTERNEAGMTRTEVTADPVRDIDADGPEELELRLERHRVELTGYCYRMLGSAFEAEDAVQETMIRAWRSFAGFESRAALRS